MEKQSIQLFMETLYNRISFESGSEPQFKRLKELFHEEAVLVEYLDANQRSYTKKNIHEHVQEMMHTFEVYPEIKAAGFYEYEINNEIYASGPIACVISRYSKTFTFQNTQRTSEGTNVLQIANLDGQLKILSLSWYE